MALICVALLAVGCSTDLSRAGKQVHLLTSGDEAAKCQQIAVITEHERHSSAVGSALKDALNDTAEAGGNAFYVVISQDTRGASIVGNALNCPQFPPVQ
jgi:hypothetical protein